MRSGLTLLLIFVSIACGACSGGRPVQFLTESDSVLYADGRAAQEGTINFSGPVKHEYRFDDSFYIAPNSSIIIEYSLNQPLSEKEEKYTLLFNTSSSSWELPLNAVSGINYAIPVDNTFNGHFSIELADFDKADKNRDIVMQIHSLKFTDRFFGFILNADGFKYLSPFVSLDSNIYTINVPLAFLPNPMSVEITAEFSPEAQSVLEFGGRRLETFLGTDSFFIPSGIFNAPGQVSLSGVGIKKFLLSAVQKDSAAFPKPLKADPALVAVWPQENWRNKSYEIFRWDRFPEILIFDYADYTVQDKMLKRLAFFAEKTGFRGRLAHDEEIRDLHGWNAHDYRTDDLAVFFNTARSEKFPLSEEERELEKILLNEGIIIEKQGSIDAGKGAIISIARESPDYLRYRFLAHEGYHGLYFIDGDFREFCRQRWDQVPVAARRFLISFFEFQQYDIKNEYLLYNEFMAHVLQQTISQTADYFGRQLPMRLESTWRSSSLPPKDEASGTWPLLADAFSREARAFSDYVNNRWGFSAGRVWGVRVR
ncbi:MAG: hypothetical protein FWB89_01870 [Treponema sp.]|nr:hypothetical protein [Treponema sp.]